MDNLGSHREWLSAKPYAERRQLFAKLFFLPKYSPDLTPIEQVLATLQHLLRKARARDFDTVCLAIDRELQSCDESTTRVHLGIGRKRDERMALRHFVLFAAFFLPISCAILDYDGASAVATMSASGVGGTLPCTYFVSVAGNDKNNGGSVMMPFATLEKARSAARNSRSKVVCLLAGTYSRSSTLNLTSADNGETWQYYAPDGVDSAVLDGGSSVNIIAFDGVSNLTINGLSLQHAFANAITAPGTNRSDHVTIENSDIGFNLHTGDEGGFNPLVFIENATNTQILNNYVHDGVSQGIGLYAFNAGESIDGSVIGGNVVTNTVQQVSDGGAIYINMRSTGDNGGRAIITNNFVRDYAASGVTGAAGIYLDDNTSNVTVTGNAVGPPTEGAVSSGNLGATAFEIHDGNNDTISGNLADLGDSGREWTAIWYQDSSSAAGMLGNTFTGNILISGFTGNQNTNFTGQTGYSYFENSAGTNFTISDNVYHNYAGGQMRTDGQNASDHNPIFVNPKIRSLTYNVEDGSPTFRPPVNFPHIIGSWGPPGFVVPPTRTTQSAR
jgi:hypothetical protein